MSLTGTELANEFSNFVNTFSGEAKQEEFVEAFCRQHRTLQQSMFGLMMKVLEKVGSDDYRFDGRNEASHKTAKMLLEGYKSQMKKTLIEQNPDFWTEEKAEDQASVCRPHYLPCV